MNPSSTEHGNSAGTVKPSNALDRLLLLKLLRPNAFILLHRTPWGDVPVDRAICRFCHVGVGHTNYARLRTLARSLTKLGPDEKLKYIGTFGTLGASDGHIADIEYEAIEKLMEGATL